MTTLVQISTGRILIGALALGILQASLERSAAYMKERHAFGKALTEFQALQFKIADMATHGHAARLMLYDAAAHRDAGERFDSDDGQAVRHGKGHGGRAPSRPDPWRQRHHDRIPGVPHLPDAKVLEIVEGTSEIQRMIVARELLR